MPSILESYDNPFGPGDEPLFPGKDGHPEGADDSMRVLYEDPGQREESAYETFRGGQPKK